MTPAIAKGKTTGTGADAIVAGLRAAGVRRLFGIPGGAVLPLYHALGESGIEHVLARHEQGAGFMAAAQGRLEGRAGVCVVSSGPGATNVLTVLADAYMDSIPLVCIAGQVPTALIGTQAFQEVATTAIARPIAKAVLFARTADELLELVPRAFALAEQGRRGPVLLDVPKDVQQQALSSTPPAWGDPSPTPGLVAPAPADHATASSAEASLAAMAACIDAAERPVLYVGGGVLAAQAGALARAFAEHAGLPTTTTLMALGMLPADHPLYLGMLGMHGAQSTNRVIEQCDVLLAIGARFDDRATGRPDRFAPHARILHIDIDPNEPGKIKTPDIAVTMDAAHALRGLLARTAPRQRRAWHATVQALRAECGLPQPGRDDARTPYGVLHALAQAATRELLVATDVGQHQMWTAQAFPFLRPGQCLTSGGLGTMGFGLPTAIGAALARPAASVACITGDGSVLMNIQEFATLAELGLDVKVLLLDNGGLGLVRQQQTLFYDRRYAASGFARGTDYVAIARAFGITAVDLAGASDVAVRAALGEAFATRAPYLLRLPIDVDAQVLPMVPPGAANTAAIA